MVAMEVATLVVAIVSAVAALGAAWFARDLGLSSAKAANAAMKAAAAAEKSASAAQASVALEVERRRRELTPQFKVTYEPEHARLSVFLTGPSDLGRLDALTVRIRDDDDLVHKMEDLVRNAEQHGLHVSAPELAGDQVWGPFRFAPKSGKTVRTAQAGEMPVGEKRTFELWLTSPPSLMQEALGTTEAWFQEAGTVLLLRLDCRREGWEPWTLPGRIETSGKLNTTEIP